MAIDGDVAIIGAGVGGLAAGIALAQRGARVAIYEQADALAEVGAGLQIGPNGVAVLEALGLRDAVEVVAAAPEAIELRDHRGRLAARLPLGPTCVARYGRPYWQAHRADLLAALAAGAAEAGVALRTGARVAAVTDEGAGVRLDLADGAQVHASVAIGADGVRSALRAATFGGRAARFTGHVAWRGLVPAERLVGPAPPADAACVYMGPGRHLVTYPLRGGSVWNFVAVEERADWTAEGWTAPADPDALRRAFAGWAPPVTALLAGVERAFLWGLFDHPPLPAWARGRIALLGDACHPMTPFLAQGAAMALEDAWVLATALAAGPGVAAGLLAYEDRRKPRATRVQRAAARNARVYHLRHPVVRGLAQAGLRAASGAGLLIGRFDWLYGANVVGGDD